MSRRYSTAGDQAAAATITIVSIDNKGTTIRPILYELDYGTIAAAADNAFHMILGRITAIGTATAVTPQPIDDGDPASLMDGGSNHTGEPTYTAGETILQFGINQQATFRWVVPPEEGITIAAVNNEGLGFKYQAVSGGTPNSVASLFHQE